LSWFSWFSWRFWKNTTNTKPTIVSLRIVEEYFLTIYCTKLLVQSEQRETHCRQWLGFFCEQHQRQNGADNPTIPLFSSAQSITWKKTKERRFFFFSYSIKREENRKETNANRNTCYSVLSNATLPSE
jgi:hypothetical protein